MKTEIIEWEGKSGNRRGLIVHGEDQGRWCFLSWDSMSNIHFWPGEAGGRATLLFSDLTKSQAKKQGVELPILRGYCLIRSEDLDPAVGFKTLEQAKSMAVIREAADFFGKFHSFIRR